MLHSAQDDNLKKQYKDFSRPLCGAAGERANKRSEVGVSRITNYSDRIPVNGCFLHHSS